MQYPDHRRLRARRRGAAAAFPGGRSARIFGPRRAISCRSTSPMPAPCGALGSHRRARSGPAPGRPAERRSLRDRAGRVGARQRRGHAPRRRGGGRRRRPARLFLHRLRLRRARRPLRARRDARADQRLRPPQARRRDDRAAHRRRSSHRPRVRRLRLSGRRQELRDGARAPRAPPANACACRAISGGHRHSPTTWPPPSASWRSRAIAASCTRSAPTI